MEEELNIAPVVLTGRQAARYLGVGYSTFRAEIQHDLDYVQRTPRGRRTFLIADLDKWIRKHRRPAASAS